MAQRLRMTASASAARAQSGTEAVLRALTCVFNPGRTGSRDAGPDAGMAMTSQAQARLRGERQATLKAFRVHFHTPQSDGAAASTGPTLSFWCMSPGVLSFQFTVRKHGIQ